MRLPNEQDVVMMVHEAIVAQYGCTFTFCGVGAWMVTQLLDAEMVDAPGHWYARSRVTGAILDPTVDQFGSDMESGRAYAEENLYPHGVVIDAESFTRLHYTPSHWEWAESALVSIRQRMRKVA